jgi:hypothetical protein
MLKQSPALGMNYTAGTQSSRHGNVISGGLPASHDHCRAGKAGLTKEADPVCADLQEGDATAHPSLRCIEDTFWATWLHLVALIHDRLMQEQAWTSWVLS